MLSADGMPSGHRFLKPVWLHRLSELRPWLFATLVGLFFQGKLALGYLLVELPDRDSSVSDPILFTAIRVFVTSVMIMPLMETMVFIALPCELLLQYPPLKRLVVRWCWIRWGPLVWGAVVFGLVHLNKELAFRLLTIPDGLAFLLVYLHMRPSSLEAAFCVTTCVHAGHNLIVTVLSLGLYLF